MSKALRILELREMIAEKEGHLFRERLSSSTLETGIPRSAITEVTGNAKVEWLVLFLKENPELKVFWIEESFTLFPPALTQRGVHPHRILFAECGKEIFPTLRKALRSHVFECVVSPSVFKDERMLKALQLLSEKSNSSLILLSTQFTELWPISLQFNVDQKGNKFQVTLRRNKCGQSDLKESSA